MSKSTKYFELFTALKSSGDNGVSPDTLQKATGFNQGALAVYIHALRHKFGAKIDSIRDGRTVVGYRLTNADELAAKILPTRKPRTVKAKVAKPKAAQRKGIVGSVTKTTKTASKEGIVDVSDLEISEYTDTDLADIRQSLGI